MAANHYVVIEGPLRVGKSSLARALAQRTHARTLLDTEDNPFLEPFYGGEKSAAFRAQMFFLFARYRQISEAQVEKSHTPVIADYMFDKDKLFAYLNLNDQEIALYDRYFEHFREMLPTPDLVVYLKASPEVLRKRIALKAVPAEARISDEYLQETVRAYEHFFQHYKDSDVLVVDTTKVDFVHNPADLEELLQELSRPVRGTQYFLPLGS